LPSSACHDEGLIRDEGKYIPHPAKWLKEECWQDEGLKVKRQLSIEVLVVMIMHGMKDWRSEQGRKCRGRGIKPRRLGMPVLNERA
jgi:hypothetical protein